MLRTCILWRISLVNNFAVISSHIEPSSKETRERKLKERKEIDKADKIQTISCQLQAKRVRAMHPKCWTLRHRKFHITFIAPTTSPPLQSPFSVRSAIDEHASNHIFVTCKTLSTLACNYILYTEQKKKKITCIHVFNASLLWIEMTLCNF